MVQPAAWGGELLRRGCNVEQLEKDQAFDDYCSAIEEMAHDPDARPQPAARGALYRYAVQGAYIGLREQYPEIVSVDGDFLRQIEGAGK